MNAGGTWEIAQILGNFNDRRKSAHEGWLALSGGRRAENVDRERLVFGAHGPVSCAEFPGVLDPAERDQR
jgi:hypothetical protein